MDVNKLPEFPPSSTPPAAGSVMNSNHFPEFISSPEPVQMHNFSPSLPLPPYNQTAFEDREEDRECRFMQLQRQNLQLFWDQRLLEILNISEFKSQLPLARTKKIMKLDKKVKMVSAETPVLLTKACELFIMELTLRSWLHAEGSDRRILHPCDIVGAVSHDEGLGFLADTVGSNPPN